MHIPRCVATKRRKQTSMLGGKKESFNDKEKERESLNARERKRTSMLGRKRKSFNLKERKKTMAKERQKPGVEGKERE
jgi:hypothetical protein